MGAYAWPNNACASTNRTRRCLLDASTCTNKAITEDAPVHASHPSPPRPPSPPFALNAAQSTSQTLLAALCFPPPHLLLLWRKGDSSIPQ